MPAGPERLDDVSRPGEERELGEEVEHVRARLRQPQLERDFVPRLRLDTFEQVSRFDCLLAHRPVGEGEVFSGERLAVAPAKPLAQAEHVRASIC